MIKKIRAIVLLLLLFVISASMCLAEVPELCLSTFSLSELNQLKKDIETEQKLHHNVTSTIENKLLKIVKDEVSKVYAAKGIEISWPWAGWNYDYNRNKDFFTLTTHTEYKDEAKKNQKVSVYAELYFDGTAFNIYKLSLDNAVIIFSDYDLPDNLLIDTTNTVINEKTGINLSLLSFEELNELESLIQNEISFNHEPKNSSAINDILKAKVEDYFSSKGTASVSWPWFDYEYTCDWNCYTEKTEITFEENGVKHRDVPVYAEFLPVGGSYQIAFLIIGDSILIDDYNIPADDNITIFLNKRSYNTALQLIEDNKYEEACILFDQLGEFDDSSKMKAHCQDVINQRKYEEAISLKSEGKYEEATQLFNELGDYSDSLVKAEECRQAAKEEIYQNAMGLMLQNKYEEAIEVFFEVIDYKDSSEKIADCRIAIMEREYGIGLAKMEEGVYEEAINIFEKLDGYADSAEKILLCHEKINRLKYEHAEQLFVSLSFEKAKEEFTSLGDYKDSREKVQQIEEILPTLNREIVVEETEIILFRNQRITLTPSVNSICTDAPANTVFSFTSRNPNVARVGRDGVVTAGQYGDTTILCAALDNPYIAKEVNIHVVKNINRVTVNPTKIDLSIPEQNGNSESQLVVKIEPEDAFIQTGVWSSNNENVVTVDPQGHVKAVGVGHTVITFVSDEKPGLRASCNVNVGQAVTLVELPESSGTVYIGKPVQMKATVQPQNAANKKLIWTSSDESILSVNANGQVKGVQPGTAVITVSSPDGPSTKYEATVKIAPATLKVSGTARCIAKNHVGNNWGYNFLLNDEEFKKGSSKSITVENGDVITVGCEIWENDANDDYGCETKEIEITPEIMQKGLKFTQTILVYENQGRYAGYAAEWEVVITIRP